MLTITVKTKGRAPYEFEWDGSLEEFHQLWDEMESLADRSGLDPLDVASAAIRTTATERQRKNATEARGQAAWIVYAVLRHAADNVDFASMIDRAGVLAAPPTVFDLAAHQHIKAEIVVDNKSATISLTGSSLLDS